MSLLNFIGQVQSVNRLLLRLIVPFAPNLPNF